MLCIEILEALDKIFPSVKLLISITPDDDLELYEVDSYEEGKNKKLLFTIMFEEANKRYRDNTIIPFIIERMKEELHV